MSLGGDLDISVIDELPPGKPFKPFIVMIQPIESLEILKDEIAKGRKCILCIH